MNAQSIDRLLDTLERRNPHEPEFLQAAEDIVRDVHDLVTEHEPLARAAVLERLLEPDRVVSFRITWEDDEGQPRVNRGYRVQTCNALGPYKGGLRFHPSVNQSILKFLGLEQTLKNSLTGLPIGGGKGGADFDPHRCSEHEIRRFCQAFMLELVHHIGPETDVPAGDIGVGDREIGYLFGQYKRLSRSFTGALTGKPMAFGGSALRSEATGYGVVHFAGCALERAGERLEERRCALSGAGNVATHCAEKLQDVGARVISLSDSGGTLRADDEPEGGLPGELPDWLRRNGHRLPEAAEKFGLEYVEGAKPWDLPCDLAFPCATENELEGPDAASLVDNGCRWVVEGANMPCTPEALECFRDADVTVCPGKAANAGGVAVSTLEMTQNASFESWDRSQVEEGLKRIMREIHRRCVAHLPAESGDYGRAANRASFERVGRALAAQGI